MTDGDDATRRDLHHLEALRASRTLLETRIAEIEALGPRRDAPGVVASMDEHLVRLIATELAESAATVGREWELAALSERRGDLEGAMAHMANAYVHVHSLMPNQIEDVGEAIWDALAALESRLEPTNGTGAVE